MKLKDALVDLNVQAANKIIKSRKSNHITERYVLHALRGKTSRLRRMFRKLDASQSGVVSEFELHQVLNRMALVLHPDQVCCTWCKSSRIFI